MDEMDLNSSNFIAEINPQKWNNLTEKINTSTLEDLGKINKYLIEIVQKYVDVQAIVVKIANKNNIFFSKIFLKTNKNEV